MKIQAKFYCARITRDAYKNETVALSAVTGVGNEGWSKFTPSGELMITISNPEAQGKFEPGASYLLTFEPAPKAAS